ncbi:MAG: TIGR01777 family oxidoreductase [Cytophagales bacterium]|nr:TIGR01777 family oxidoreductase [Cytophagales bacterium]MDW8383899.1 TIGR01777 family oxidoreductase [Flammeovirgaceae bacterium]
MKQTTETPPNVLISGGTGLVGKHLTKLLQERGYTVCYLSRQKTAQSGVLSYYWNPERGELDEKAIRKADYVVHLAGANVGEKRWTEARKQEILESRTLSTELLADALESVPHQVKAFIGASAIGIYGDTLDNAASEDSPHGNDFLANVCKEWEKQVSLIIDAGIRTVVFRIGVVLARESGALPKMSLPVRWGVGAPIASGKQWISWIHIYDLCRMFLFGIENPSLQGIFNAVANATTNRQFITQIARELKKPLWIPSIPLFFLKWALGEMHCLVTTSCKVSNQKIKSAGFSFEFEDLERALRDLL